MILGYIYIIHSTGIYYIEKIHIIPEYRSRALERFLVNFCEYRYNYINIIITFIRNMT